MLIESPGRILITGEKGFLGSHLWVHLRNLGFRCSALNCDLLDKASVKTRVMEVSPHYIVHLAGISFVGVDDKSMINYVNVGGTLNLLDSIRQLSIPPIKTLLMSSATVYGNSRVPMLDESVTPHPSSAYGFSKLLMEKVSEEYFDHFDIGILRLFNLTGKCQDQKFVIPKIVAAYKNNQRVLKIGNLDVYREFNDVRDFLRLIPLILKSELRSDILNVCSGRVISLNDVMKIMNDISGRKLRVESDPKFVRPNEVKILRGNPAKMEKLLGSGFSLEIKDTLQHMYSG